MQTQYAVPVEPQVFALLEQASREEHRDKSEIVSDLIRRHSLLMEMTKMQAVFEPLARERRISFRRRYFPRCFVRAFLDANILVSSFSFEGVTRRLVARLLESHTIIVSPQVLEEFKRVSIDKIRVDPRIIESFLQQFTKTVEVILPPYENKLAIRDPTDVDILAAAIKAKADVLVSGDKDLLEFKHSPIPVLTPRALYDKLFS